MWALVGCPKATGRLLEVKSLHKLMLELDDVSRQKTRSEVALYDCSSASAACPASLTFAAVALSLAFSLAASSSEQTQHTLGSLAWLCLIALSHKLVRDWLAEGVPGCGPAATPGIQKGKCGDSGLLEGWLLFSSQFSQMIFSVRKLNEGNFTFIVLNNIL